jgi:hypothetical protein
MLLPALAILAGCASVPQPLVETGGATYSLGDAAPAESLFRERKTSVEVKFRCEGSGGLQKLIFGDLRSEDGECQPALLEKSGGRWAALTLQDPQLDQYGWEYVASDNDGNQLVAVLDCQVEAPGWDLVLVASVDGGHTWERRTVLRKVSYLDQFHDLVMSRDGKGRLTLLVGNAVPDESKEGLYHYRTADGGRTWTGPYHEPNYIYKVDQEREGKIIRSVKELED